MKCLDRRKYWVRTYRHGVEYSLLALVIDKVTAAACEKML
jgi:hypothetical protein